jgi:hypothetical protein
MQVADAETGELATLNSRTIFAGEEEVASSLRLPPGVPVGDAREQFAASRVRRGLPPITSPAPAALAVSAEEAAELHMLRERLEEQVRLAIEREQKREESRQSALAAAAHSSKREILRKEFAQERRQARREIENLRFDNEMALAHKLARMGLLK